MHVPVMPMEHWLHDSHAKGMSPMMLELETVGVRRSVYGAGHE